MASSPPFSYEAYLNSRKQEIHDRLYSLKNSVSQVHQWLCQYQEPWVTDGQLRYAIKKWQRQEPNRWGALPILTRPSAGNIQGFGGDNMATGRWDHSLYLYPNSAQDSSSMASNVGLNADVFQYQSYGSVSVNPDYFGGNNIDNNLDLGTILGMNYTTDCGEDDSSKNGRDITPAQQGH
ncbi:uncharacterized protein PAC_20099 [Phialocephala subalpina]|uniref:Uncharacterized protein n=1 Tax=Phialocephala subalpina TaxID=576137 RepID=A0A1L7XYV0_9HELO|nr:uncharacterized protein PAC_20099 [Phialocephala subalpina]